MSGIDKLVKGTVGTLAKDKATDILSPLQLDFLTFALNPQAYLLDKGINAAADALGYGSQYRELKGGAQDEKDYYKQVMRDTIGDVLPGSVGDFVRSTPRATEEDLQPAGSYVSWDPGSQSWTQNESSSPVAVFDNFAGDRFAAANDINSLYNTNSQNYVGPASPKDMNSSIYSSNLTDLLSMLGNYEAPAMSGMPNKEDKASFEEGDMFDPNLGMNVPLHNSGNGASPSGDLSYTEMIDILNSPSSYGNGGTGGGKGLETYDMAEYKYGGQIRGGTR